MSPIVYPSFNAKSTKYSGNPLNLRELPLFSRYRTACY
nr:MAG TPA: hypothetical protein [Caudoviricetes sp.]